jgi:DNA-binding NarL/FixJ family response regulator
MASRILIVDDHQVVREGIRAVIRRSRPHWEICGEAANGEVAIQLVQSLQPEVVVMDITMPGMSGLAASRRISELGLASRVLIFTMHESQQLVHDVRAAGAKGYVFKSRAGIDLVAAIETLLSGGTFFGRPEKPVAPESPSPSSGNAFCWGQGLAWGFSG